MRQGIGGCIMVLAMAFVASGMAHAEAGTLDHDELAQCASQVRQLRADSARLTQQHVSLDARRSDINQRSAALQAEAANVDPNDLAKGLDLQQRQKAHNEETLAFNAQIEQLKTDIGALNEVRSGYDQRCSNRSYRRRDLESLPQADREAMRAGMDDVQVPYVGTEAPLR